jgi:DNA-binding transcriptional regulator YiaG
MTPAEIRALRESRGETQARFGVAVAEVLRRPAYHWTTVARWESGVHESDVPWHLVTPKLARRSA